MMKAEKTQTQVIFFLSAFLLLIPSFTFSQGRTTDKKITTRVLFVLDASTSMSLNWENTSKIAAAKTLIIAMLDSLQPVGNVQVGLRVYGHLKTEGENDCLDSKLEVPFSNNSFNLIPQALSSIHPLGTSPIAYSLLQAAGDFPSDKNARNMIVLLTDGVESCHGDPCAVSKSLQEQHVIIRPFIIGLNTDTSLNNALSCIGEFYRASSPDVLFQIASKVLKGLITEGGLTIRLMDGNNKPTESDVNMTFYQKGAGIPGNNFYHSINSHGVPDTVHPDPRFTYGITIQTTPSIAVDSLKIKSGEIKTLEVPAAQGWLQVSFRGSITNKPLSNKIKCLAQAQSYPDQFFLMDMNSKLKVLAGTYSLQISTLPITLLPDVKVLAGSTTSIQIDAPGLLTIGKSAGYIGSILASQDQVPVKIYELRENQTNELIGLQPGTYEIVIRMKNAHNPAQTILKTFNIKSGQSLSLSF